MSATVAAGLRPAGAPATGTPIGAPQRTGAAIRATRDPRGAEYEAIAKLSREVIEKICWEVIPEIVEAVVKENLDKFKK
jgi:hypothetical protein